jgi:hypothetical protein
MLLIELVNNVKGRLKIDDVDPGGLNDFVIEIKRSEENEGVFYEFGLDLNYYKKAREFIRDVKETQGIQAQIDVNIYSYNTNQYQNELVYQGQLNLNDYKLTELAATCTLEQLGFDREFVNLADRDFRLEAVESFNGTTIPVTPFLDLLYPSKTIQKAIRTKPIVNTFEQPGLNPTGCDNNRDFIIYGNIANDDVITNELENSFTIPWAFNETIPINFYTATEAGTANLDVRLNLRHTVTAVRTGVFTVEGCGGNALGNLEIKAFYRHEDALGSLKNEVQIGSDWVIPTCPGILTFTSEWEQKELTLNNITIEIGDKIFVYYTVRITANYQQPFSAAASTLSHTLKVESDLDNTFVDLVSNTTFEDTTAKTYQIYEALEKMCQYITGEQDCFRSDFFGRTDTVPAYPEDGEGALLGLTNGRALRGLSEQDIFVKWNDMFQSLDSLYSLGWGYAVDDVTGNRVIRLEKKEFFYDKDTVVFDFGKVGALEELVESEKYSGTVEIGYPKIQTINQTNASDEFNSSFNV